MNGSLHARRILAAAMFAAGAGCLAAADAPKTETPPPDAIKAAQAALQSLKLSGAVPGADKQGGLPSIDAPAIVIPPTESAPSLAPADIRRDPGASAKAVQAGRGWLVEAMTGAKGPATDGVAPGLALPGDPTAIVAPAADIGAPPPAAPNPLGDFLTSWISDRDPALFSAANPAPAPMNAGAEASDAANASILATIAASRPPAMPAIEMRDNPFLGSVAPAVVAAPARAPAIPPAAATRAPDDSPAALRPEPVVDFAKRAEDAKYFPQLKRF